MLISNLASLDGLVLSSLPQTDDGKIRFKITEIYHEQGLSPSYEKELDAAGIYFEQHGKDYVMRIDECVAFQDLEDVIGDKNPTEILVYPVIN